ncbi:MAG: DUF1178 family protein [Proteobacteria bacterium]|nr:DUF1178 family protein [Pseudomonadota bacterium]
MIHYQLQCEHGHGFDGWFRDSGSFDRQVETGLVVCPICNSPEVTRALMTPALGRGSRGKTLPRDDEPSTSHHAVDPAVPTLAPANPSPLATNAAPDKLRALLHRLRAEVESHCDYVGAGFAEEARRIHYGETKSHNIYGEATRDQAEALADEGIAFGVIPWLPPTDS